MTISGQQLRKNEGTLSKIMNQRKKSSEIKSKQKITKTKKKSEKEQNL